MSESEPPTERETREWIGKFRGPVDSVLYQMGLDGWLTESSGDVQSPTGWFGWVYNSAREIDEVAQAMSEAIADAGTTPAELIGAWVVREDEQGFVTAEEYDSEQEARDAFNELDAEYVSWLEGEQ